MAERSMGPNIRVPLPDQTNWATHTILPLLASVMQKKQADEQNQRADMRAVVPAMINQGQAQMGGTGQGPGNFMFAGAPWEQNTNPLGTIGKQHTALKMKKLENEMSGKPTTAAADKYARYNAGMYMQNMYMDENFQAARKSGKVDIAKVQQDVYQDFLKGYWAMQNGQGKAETTPYDGGGQVSTYKGAEYKIGQPIKGKGGKNYKITGFYPDGEPKVDPV